MSKNASKIEDISFDTLCAIISSNGKNICSISRHTAMSLYHLMRSNEEAGTSILVSAKWDIPSDQVYGKPPIMEGTYDRCYSGAFDIAKGQVQVALSEGDNITGESLRQWYSVFLSFSNKQVRKLLIGELRLQVMRIVEQERIREIEEAERIEQMRVLNSLISNISAPAKKAV